MRGPMYATSSPRTSRYHRIALCRSETTIAIVSMPRTPMFSPRGATEFRAMNLPATFGESLVPGTAAVHLGVPLHDFVVRDAFELPETLAGLPHVVLEPRVGREGFRRRHAEAPDDPAQDLSAGLIPTDLQVRNEAIAVVRVPRHVESLVQVPERGRGRGAAEVREDEESLARDRALLFDQLQDRLHVFGESCSFRGLEETEVVLGAVGPVFGDREALGEQTVPMQSVQRSEVFHTQPCREIGSEPTEGFRGPDRIREPRLGRDALLVERVGKKIALLEVDGHDWPVRDGIGDRLARGLPQGRQILREDVHLAFRLPGDQDAGHEALLLETVYEPLEFIPLEPGPFSDPGKGHRAVGGEEALHERFDGILHFLRGRVEGRIQVPRGPAIALELSDHVHVVVEFVEGLDLPELFLQEESLHLRLVEDLAGFALPLEALEVPREHELELLIHEEVARGDDALRFEVA